MSRKRFSYLLEKYQRGECTPRERRFVEYWFGLLDTEYVEKNNEVDWENLEEKLWQQMQSQMHPSKDKKSESKWIANKSMFTWISLAACICLVCLFLMNGRLEFNTLFSNSEKETSSWIKKSNKSRVDETIKLEDGSLVNLAPGSSIKYPAHFGKLNRVVFLNGKAFFNITKNPENPFFVYSGHMVTRVLGTSFYVQEKEGDNLTEVEVVTGTVAVYENITDNTKKGNNVVLKPNQQTKFYAGQHKFVTSLVDNPRLMVENNPDGIFKFYNTPLSQVLENLHHSYGVDIVLENRQMSACPLTANLTGQPLYTKLDIICAALGANYKIKGTAIFLSGKSCLKSTT